MKKTVITAALLFISANTLFALKAKYSASHLMVAIGITGDTLKTLNYHSEKAITCNVQGCIQSTLDSVKQYSLSSYILVYKVTGGKWAVERQPRLSIVNGYKIKRITILENRIEVMGVKYPDKKYVVILE